MLCEVCGERGARLGVRHRLRQRAARHAQVSEQGGAEARVGGEGEQQVFGADERVAPRLSLLPRPFHQRFQVAAQHLRRPGAAPRHPGLAVHEAGGQGAGGARRRARTLQQPTSQRLRLVQQR